MMLRSLKIWFLLISVMGAVAYNASSALSINGERPLALHDENVRGFSYSFPVRAGLKGMGVKVEENGNILVASFSENNIGSIICANYGIVSKEAVPLEVIPLSAGEDPLPCEEPVKISIKSEKDLITHNLFEARESIVVTCVEDVKVNRSIFRAVQDIEMTSPKMAFTNSFFLLEGH